MAAEPLAAGSGLTVSIAVPDGWYMPAPASLTGWEAESDTAAAGGFPLREVMSGLAMESSASGVVACAFGTLPGPDGGRFGASCVLAVRPALADGEVATAMQRISAADPGAGPREEICRLELAGLAGRLAWTPALGARGERVCCVEFYVPFPGEDDRRAAVLACSAVAVAPSREVFAVLDSLAATLCFMEPETEAEALAVASCR